jgi:hypothetical protein
MQKIRTPSLRNVHWSPGHTNIPSNQARASEIPLYHWSDNFTCKNHRRKQFCIGGLISQGRLLGHYFPLKLYRLLLVCKLLRGGGGGGGGLKSPSPPPPPRCLPLSFHHKCHKILKSYLKPRKLHVQGCLSRHRSRIIREL